ncbi:MAG: tetratricopeptide repeat protein [Desulfomonilia bacterium]
MMNNRYVLVAIFVVLLVLPGTALGLPPLIGSPGENHGKSEAIDKSSFYAGYDLFITGEYTEACPLLFAYMNAYSPDVEDYEWAEFFLGVSLVKLGLSHAAVDILTHLVTRKPNPRIVTYCLEIFEEISRTHPFDDEQLIGRALCGESYDFVENDLADFIHYHQGMFDWEHGFLAWGNAHFDKISRQSYYFSKYRYQQALLMVSQERIDEAISLLNDILSDSCGDVKIQDDTRTTLARLLYEKGRFEEADLLYREIGLSILEQSQNLMERAWVQYRLGNPERAMGLLYAFEAPSFRNDFTPEYYILKSFIYKDVCHYSSALDVVNEFRHRYGSCLDDINHRAEFSHNETLLLLILNRPFVHKIWDFLHVLEEEKETCTQFFGQPGQGQSGFHTYLVHIYDLQIEESSEVFRSRMRQEYESFADDLLAYEEKANLMAYEIGLDMYQRVGQYHYEKEEDRPSPSHDTTVVYPFQGEFWNDELSDYRVILPNKCSELEEWDVFFK